jgi:hypothetical protein
LSSGRQDILFKKAVDAVSYYLVPSLVETLVGRLEQGHSLTIGPCTLSRQGVAFSTGWIFTKDRLVPWPDVSTSMEGGHVSLRNTSDRRVSTNMALIDTDNAAILPILCSVMAEKEP